MYRCLFPKFARFLVMMLCMGVTVNAQQSATSIQVQPTLNQVVIESRDWLVDLIRMDTTNPPGNTAEAAKYVVELLQKENISSEVLEIAPGRAVAVGRLQAGPLPNPSNALLLVAHFDVVGVDKSKWSVDPFVGAVKDGYLYGRGAIDDKGMLAANLAVMVALKRSGIRLNRDVIFLANDAEEQDGSTSMKILIDRHWNKIACGFALNEGGRVLLKSGKVQYVGIQASEKVPYNVAVIASGTSGHASVPRPDNPVAHLAAAIEKIGAMPKTPQLMTITRRYFEQLSQIEDDETAKWMRALETPVRFDLATMRLSEMSPVWGAMLHDSIAPTELRASAHSNGVPSEARANLNIRLLPGNSIDALQAQMKKAVNDPQIRFEVQPGAGIAAPPSSLESELYQAISRAAPQQFPGAAVVPLLSAAATDSSELRLHNVQAYGLLPFPLTEADEQRMHGDDERLPLASFQAGVEFLYRTVHEFAAAK